MSNDTLEGKLNELAAQVSELGRLKDEVAALKKELSARDRRITDLEDIEAIQRLQCAYGYYLEHWMGQEIIDCFSQDPGVSATFVEGTYKGPEGIRRYFGHMQETSPDFMHMVMQTTPLITSSGDGRTAKGRWYGYGAVAMPTGPGVRQVIMSVVYEMEYVKEDGIWKIYRLELAMHYAYAPEKGWVAPEKVKLAEQPSEPMQLNPDEWAPFDTGYPSGYTLPHSFRHPVTGKVTSERERNARLKMPPNPYKALYS